MELKWKSLNEENKYENHWIKVTEHSVIDPNGNTGIYGKVHFKQKSVGIIPILKGNKTVLVGQHRFPTQSYSWEIPMGGAESGEDLLVAAKRELKEETGITAKHWVKLIETEPSSGVTDEKAVVYYCSNIQFTRKAEEESECITIRIVDFTEAYSRALNGKIMDAVSIAAILKMNILFSSNSIAIDK